MPTALFGHPIAANKMLVIAAAAGLGLVLVSFIFVALFSMGRRKRLLARLNSVGATVDGYQERANVVGQYADHYFNSLIDAADPRKLQAALTNLDRAMRHVDQLIAGRHFREADLILQFLEGDNSAWQEEWADVGGLHLETLKSWESNLENMIQLTGQQVAAASQSMKDLGVKKTNRARKPTMLGLKEAGVFVKDDSDDTGGDPE
jgi:hypothetical protein